MKIRPARNPVVRKMIERRQSAGIHKQDGRTLDENIDIKEQLEEIDEETINSINRGLDQSKAGNIKPLDLSYLADGEEEENIHDMLEEIFNNIKQEQKEALKKHPNIKWIENKE